VGTELSKAGYSHANALILNDKVVLAGDGDGEGEKWHLGVDGAAFLYPYAHDGSVSRASVIAAKSQAAQAGHADVVDAADKLLEKIDGDKASVDFAVGEMTTEIVIGEDGPPTEFKVFDAPTYETLTGPYVVDEESVASIMAHRMRRGVDIVIDWDHQTQFSEKNGQPAPAAGWAKGLEVRDDGVYAVGVTWTERASQALASREYRYISPAWFYNKKTRQITALNTIGITNNPGTLGATPIAAHAANTNSSMDQESIMSELLKVLGTDTEAEAIASVTKMREDGEQKAADLKAANEALASATAAKEQTDKLIADVCEVVGADDASTVLAKVAANKDASEKEAAASEALAKMQAEKDAAEKDALIEKASVGHDRKEWLKKQDLDTVRSYVENCCKTPEVGGEPQSARANDDMETTPDDWFVSLHSDKSGDELKAEWAAHQAHRDKLLGASE